MYVKCYLGGQNFLQKLIPDDETRPGSFTAGAEGAQIRGLGHSYQIHEKTLQK